MLLSVLFSVFALTQTKINFEKTTFSEILEKAKKEKKLIFLDAYAVWCGPCKLMDKNVFTDSMVASYFNANYINAKIDMEKGEGIALAQKFGVRSYPTLMILNADGEVVGRELGYQDPNMLIAFGEAHNKPQNMEGSLKERYQRGDRDQSLLMGLINAYGATDAGLAKEASETYFKNKKDLEFSPEEINALFGFVTSVNDSNFSYIQKNKDVLVKMIGPDNYKMVVDRVYMMDVFQKSLDLKTQTINDDLFINEASKFITKEEASKMLNSVKLNFYPSVGNFVAYEKVALETFKNGENVSLAELAKAANIFNEYVSNKTSLEKATIWAEKLVMSQDTFEATSLMAQLYDKIGKKKEAKMYADIAMVRSKEVQNADTSALIKILNNK